MVYEDISADELAEIFNQVDKEFEKNGVPSDEELMKEIEKLNKTGQN